MISVGRCESSFSLDVSNESSVEIERQYLCPALYDPYYTLLESSEISLGLSTELRLFDTRGDRDLGASINFASGDENF